VRADDLSAIPLVGLVRRNPDMAGSIVDDVIYGCANQAGEDNRNVARMAVLLAGMPVSVPGTTVNRLCRSGMAAEDMAARAIRSGDCKVMLAMPREPVLPADGPHANPDGGAIAMGHPPGMSGARLITSAICQLQRRGGLYGLCIMCVGMGQGIALIIERV
jgi:acetyl-CoA acetyltransferase